MATGTLQHRRADSATLLAATGADGEIFLDTDNYKPLFGDGATPGGILVDGARVNAQVGTGYAILNTDVGKLVTFSNGSPVAVTMAQAGSGSGAYFKAQSKVQVLNLNTGTVTITPATSTINGQATLVLEQYEGAIIWSNGANYFAIIGRASSGSSALILTNETSNFSILAGDIGTRYNNDGAVGNVDGSLPAAAPGLWYGFAIHAAFYIKAIADGTDTIAIGGNNSSTGGYVRSNLPFSFLILECHIAGQWIASTSVGAWSIDS